MSLDISGLIHALDQRVDKMADACTRCGKCVEACPMPEPANIDVSEPGAVISGILDILRTGSGPEVSKRWANVCSGSGCCISACDESVNPRFLLAMARRAMLKRSSAADRRREGREQFKAMSRGVKVLSRLQLSPDMLERLSPSSYPDAEQPPELVFYTGCNLLKTPHIGLLCLDVLDRLEVRYEVHGGPSACCGVFQARSGDDENALRQAGRTIQRFTATRSPRVLAWCPTCQIQFQETMLPVQIEPMVPERPIFHMTMFPIFLAERLDALREHMTHPVQKTVALHEHPGSAGVTEAVQAVLGAIPGLELVPLGVPRLGYNLASLVTVPEKQKTLLASELAAAEAAGVTTLAGIYHSDHRELSAHHGQWSFEIVNFMELVGASMGIHHEDIFKRLKTMREVDAILTEVADMLAVGGIDAEEAREVIIADLQGEQILPVNRREQTPYVEPLEHL